MAVTSVFSKYTTYDSQFLSRDVRSIAAAVEHNLTTTWDLFQNAAPGTSKDLEWYDYQKNPLSGTVAGAGWTDAVTLTALPINNELAITMNVGDILMIEDEQVIVKVVDRTGNTIDVYARGHGGSTAAAHVATTPIKVIGNAHVEGGVTAEAVVVDNLQRKNYYQLLEEMINLTKTGANQQYRDTTDKLRELREKAMIRGLKKLNLTALFGLPEIGTKTTPGSAGGIRHFLSNPDVTNTDAGGTFTEAVLKATLLEVGNRGGTPNIILCSPTDKSTINGFNAVTSAGVQTRVDRAENVAGTIVDWYEGEGVGRLAVISDPLLQTNEIYILNNRKMKKQWFANDNLRFEAEPSLSTSRNTVETLQGQFSFELNDTVNDFARIFNT